MQTSQLHAARYLLLALLFQASSAAAQDAHNQLTAEEQTAGWQLLFDGRSLDAWRSYGKPAPDPRWQALDGELTLTERGGGDLFTNQAWADFELQLEWKISEGGNSGIFFLAEESEERISSKAPEVQILDDARHSDNQIDTHRSGSLYDLIAAPPESQIPAGLWNKVTIIHEDGHLQVWQNAVQTVDIQIGGQRWDALIARSKFATWEGFGTLTSGHIGLQDHGDVVAFRNMMIRSLQGGNAGRTARVQGMMRTD